MTLAAAIERAARSVRAGGVIAYPTEAVFGLGCDPDNTAAVARIIELKGRGQDKGLILIAADWSQLQPFVAPLPEALRTRIDATWPGPNTWILPALAQVSDLLTGGTGRIAVRVSAFAPVIDLCQACARALVSTSANPAGRAPARTAAEVQAYFPSGLDYVLDAATGGAEQPSRLFDGADGRRLR